MALLSSVPELPSEHDLAKLRDAFCATFKSHIFLGAVELGTSSAVVPPYLQLAMAAISAVTSPVPINYLSGAPKSTSESSLDLFVAGVSVWSVMLETDNREARLLEAVVAVSSRPVIPVQSNSNLIFGSQGCTSNHLRYPFSKWKRVSTIHGASISSNHSESPLRALALASCS